MSGPERTMMFVYKTGLTAKLSGTGSMRGKEWTLGAGTFSIGREPTNDLPLATEPGVSKVHCKIAMEDGQYVVEDQESRNGTLVNGQAVKRSVLKDGDQLRICNAIFKFTQEGGTDPATLPAVPDPPAPPPRAPAEDAPPAAAAKPAASKGKGKTKAPPPKPRSAAPFFLLGMVLFSGFAGAALYVSGVLDPLVNGGGTKARSVADPRPIPDDPKRGADVAAGGTKASPADKPGEGTADTSAKVDPPGSTTTTPPPAGGSALPTALEGTLSVVAGSGGGEGVKVAHTQERKVGAVLVKVGSAVRKGQALLQYEDPEASRRLATQRELFNQLKEVAAASNSPRAQKELDSAKADLDRASSAVSALRLNAPADGTVQELVASAGARGKKGEPAVVLAAGGSADVVTVVVPVPGPLEARFRKGARAKVTVGGRTVDATVEKLADGKATLTLPEKPRDAADGAAASVAVPH